MDRAEWRWPDGSRVAVVFNVCVEAWSDGVAPGISPMGNPLPPGLVDSMAISWAAYVVKRGVHRLIEVFGRHRARASMMVNAIVAERDPAAVRAIGEAGHEVLSHSYAMDVVPLLLDEAAERANIQRCTRLLEAASGRKVVGWLSPRGTPSPRTPRLLAEAGYRWYGDVFDDDLPYVQEIDGRRIVAIPLGTDVNDMPFMKYGNPPRLMRESFEENLAIALRPDRGPAILDVTVHAHIFGRPRGADLLEQIVERAVGSTGVWVATRAEIAEHVLAGGTGG